MASRPVPEPEPESLSGGFGTIYINQIGSELLYNKSLCKVAARFLVGPSWGVRFLPLATTCFCCTTTSLTGRSVGDSFAVADAWQRVREDSGESPSPGRRESLVPDGNRTPSFDVIYFRPLVRSKCKVRTLGTVFGQPIPC